MISESLKNWLKRQGKKLLGVAGWLLFALIMISVMAGMVSMIQ